MKTFTPSFFHRKSIMLKQNTIKEEHKIITKKYILYNMKTVVRGFHNMIIEESGFNGSCGWVISSRRVKEITTFTLRVNGQFTDL